MEKFAAGYGSCHQIVRQPGNQRMSGTLSSHAVLNRGNMVAQLFGKILHAMDQRLGIAAQLFRQFAPFANSNVAQTVLAAQLHGDLGKDTWNLSFCGTFPSAPGDSVISPVL